MPASVAKTRDTKAPASREPMIKLEEGGRAPVLSYNVPEPTSYEGQHLIALQLPPEHFKPEFLSDGSDVVPLSSPEVTLERVRKVMDEGFNDARLFPNFGVEPGYLFFNRNYNVEGEPRLWSRDRTARLSTELLSLTPESVLGQMKAGLRPTIVKTLAGELTVKWIEDVVVQPRLVLIEKYRLSSFLGSYGAGRTINTFSLLPGERTKITIRTFKRTAETKKEASSILDSFSKSSADDFEKAVASEQTDKQAQAESHAWSVEAEASGNWGVASVSVKAGYKGSLNTSREQFAKNVSNATQKHSASASNKRDISVTSSAETTTETEDESSVEREIQNINVGRTLNFVFRQMNQEYITLLHLVDVMVAFSNGIRENAVILPLPRLRGLLEDVVRPDEVDGAFDYILGELGFISDYQDELQSFVEWRELKDGARVNKYLRVKKNMTSVYKDPATGTEIKVPGIIVAANTLVMRTDGLIAEALLGEGDGLDRYSHGLQDQAVRAQELANLVAELQVRRATLAEEIVRSKNASNAELFLKLFPPPPAPCDCHGKEKEK